MADVSPPHPIYLRVLAELESQCPTLWKGPIILRLEKIAKRVLIFEIPQIVFLLKKNNHSSQNQICKPKYN